MMTTPKASLLLGVCCVLAIAAVGSIFELSSGAPQYGVPFTLTVLVLSIPLAAWAFIAAVQDARANL